MFTSQNKSVGTLSSFSFSEKRSLFFLLAHGNVGVCEEGRSYSARQECSLSQTGYLWLLSWVFSLRPRESLPSGSSRQGLCGFNLWWETGHCCRGLDHVENVDRRTDQLPATAERNSLRFTFYSAHSCQTNALKKIWMSSRTRPEDVYIIGLACCSDRRRRRNFPLHAVNQDCFDLSYPR